MPKRLDRSISRRRFLSAAAVGAGLLLDAVGPGGALSSLEAKKRAAGPVRRGGLLTLPHKGRLFVASDFHARLSDFETWLKKTDLPRRLKAGEDVYGLILGDVVDRKTGDPLAEADGDTRILNRLRTLRKDLGRKADRLTLILGNHERDVMQAYELIRKQPGFTTKGQMEFVKALYDGPKGSYFRQFNFIERIDEELYAFLKGLPVCVRTPSGFVGVHGGPARSMRTLGQIENRDPAIVKELVWSRPSPLSSLMYTEEDVERFLGILRGKLVVTGHTTHRSLPSGWVKNRLGYMGSHLAVLATSYGALKEGKAYLDLDLSRGLTGSAELRPGIEIRPLEG